MAKPLIRVMLSSRCLDSFPTGSESTLTDLRKELKTEIESAHVLGRKLFEVWINEDAPPAEGTQDSWETCLQAVRDCDVLIVLSNGNAGWAMSEQDIGICHAEYMEGLRSAQAKVRLVALPTVADVKGAAGERNRRFQDYLSRQTAFRGGEVTTVAEAKRRVFDALSDAVITLAQRGVKAAASARFDVGAALDWTRLDFRQRKMAMESTLKSALGGLKGAKVLDSGVVVSLDNKDVAVVVHAIPASFSIAAARELVGRPFLEDHQRIKLLTSAHGPLHLIACHRGATETQAMSLLGFPDATVVSGPFGVFVADDVQKVQFAFLANCRDDSQTRHASQRFFEWLLQTGEGVQVARRAVSRARIVKVVAKEMNT
ncbi:DUF4062 domain-containing protein [Achromobacter mucicolens]|uniref:DUF4062 domain-containing protein n=1 Tax=Achromobacter mucicolens TaxID=1389922 RepID=A0ABD4Z2C8_9BURK|nr:MULTISPECIES: DUF4062 domain-containing protein [Achromobacter]MDH1181927.1 DUF4062 domain-containing protein [Achromobacter mucicolens]WLW62795.1 DUF4062 domain-containing protein [Achromobacter aegrifaciens]